MRIQVLGLQRANAPSPGESALVAGHELLCMRGMSHVTLLVLAGQGHTDGEDGDRLSSGSKQLRKRQPEGLWGRMVESSGPR